MRIILFGMLKKIWTKFKEKGDNSSGNFGRSWGKF